MIRIGVAGVGAAGRAFIAAVRAHPGFTLGAIADPAEDARASAAAGEGMRAYPDLGAMLADPSLDAICIATPTELHAAQAIAAFAASKHVLLEKPMATSIADAQAIIEASERSGKALVVGHSHSYDEPIARMREIVDEGTLGAARMANTWCFSDWVYRPRRPEELAVANGGGVTFRQGAHQLDILRLLCGGLATSVRARTFDFDPSRPTVGAHVAFVDFAGGAVGTAVYNGYGHLPGAELTFGIGEWGLPIDATPRRTRGAIPAQAPHPPFFGLTVLSCERGDIRQVPEGLAVYTGEGTTVVRISPARSPRERVLDELHDAIARAKPPLHGGRWALASLELCIATMESGRLGGEVALRHQVPLR